MIITSRKSFIPRPKQSVKNLLPIVEDNVKKWTKEETRGDVIYIQLERIESSGNEIELQNARSEPPGRNKSILYTRQISCLWSNIYALIFHHPCSILLAERERERERDRSYTRRRNRGTPWGWRENIARIRGRRQAMKQKVILYRRKRKRQMRIFVVKTFALEKNARRL